LPLTVVVKQVFNILVTRITTRSIDRTPPPQVPKIQSEPRHPITFQTRPPALLPSGPLIIKSAVGSFQVNIPVTTEAELLPGELDKLAIFKARLAAMSPQDRWYPVLKRYVGYISGRVDGLGGAGTAASIPPSFGGAPVPGLDEICCTGHVTGLLFDGSGDFEGFLIVFDEKRKHEDKFKYLESFKYTREHEYRINIREPHVHELIEHVWHRHLCITICLDGRKPHTLRHIILRDFSGEGKHDSGVFGKFLNV